MGVYDSWDVECHLTRTGWVEGSEWEFGKQVTDVPPPGDRVLTLMVSTRQSSGWSKENVRAKETWRAPSATEEELQVLRKKHPLPRRFGEEIMFL
jgi:hypothetical protein